MAEAPELAGCAAHGATRQAALEHAAEAIGLWVETAFELGDPAHAPKGWRPLPA